MTAETLTLFAGAILSLGFSYIPKLNTWFDLLLPEYKRLIMAGLTLAVAAVSYGLACAGLADQFGVAVTCDQAGLIGLLQAWVFAIVGNQAAYSLTPRRG